MQAREPDAGAQAGADDRWKVVSHYHTMRLSKVQPGDVLRTKGDGTQADPVELPRKGGDALPAYANRHRVVDRVEQTDAGHVVHFTDGTSAEPDKPTTTVFRGDQEKVPTGGALTGRGRPDGAGTENDPIDVNGDLDRAVDLLAQGKHVRLNQPNEVSTLIGKLGKLVNDARAAGGTAPTIDLCQVTVAGTNLFCVGNKGHKRIDMPQLEGTALPGTDADKLERNAKGFVDVSDQFRQALNDAGVKVTDKNRPANTLRATQSEMNAGIVARIAGEIEQGRTDDPIYVTRDGYIIDGHHVWAANVAVDAKDNRLGDVQTPVHEIDMDIGAAIDFARDFAARVGLAGAAVNVPASAPAQG